MIPSFKPGIMSSNQIRVAAGGGADVTPNPIDWLDGLDSAPAKAYSSTETITGINTAINIFYTFNYANGPSYQIYYSKNGGSDIALNENTNLSVSNNDTIKWGLSSGLFYAEIEMQIKNASDGNAVLDTVYLYVAPP